MNSFLTAAKPLHPDFSVHLDVQHYAGLTCRTVWSGSCWVLLWCFPSRGRRWWWLWRTLLPGWRYIHSELQLERICYLKNGRIKHKSTILGSEGQKPTWNQSVLCWMHCILDHRLASQLWLEATDERFWCFFIFRNNVHEWIIQSKTRNSIKGQLVSCRLQMNVFLMRSYKQDHKGHFTAEP